MCTRMKRAKLLKLESVQALGADGGIFIISAFPLHQSCCVDLTRPMKSFRLHLRPKNLLFLKLMEKYVRRDSLVHSYQCFRNFISSSEENLSFSGSVRAHRVDSFSIDQHWNVDIYCSIYIHNSSKGWTNNSK